MIAGLATTIHARVRDDPAIFPEWTRRIADSVQAAITTQRSEIGTRRHTTFMPANWPSIAA
jgi:hypothetical protein